MENAIIKKQLTSKEHVKENFLIFMKNCTFHGVQDLYASKSIYLKLLWTIILIFAVVCSLYGCYSVVKESLDSPVVVSYFVREMDKHWILPDVIICPFNRFNRSYFQELNISRSLSQYLDLSFPSPLVHPFQMDEYRDTVKNLDQNQGALEELLTKIGNISFTEFMKRSAIDCSAFFQDRSICKEARDIMSSAGKCFRIPGKIQHGHGFGYGHRLIINLPKHLYQPGVNQMFNDGIAVKLVAPGRGVDHDLTFIPSGKKFFNHKSKFLGVHAIMPLKATKFEFKNDPPRYSCNKDVKKTYSRMWCYEACLMEPAEHDCNCSLAASSRQRKQEICTTKQFFSCFAKFLYIDAHDQQEKCKKECRQRCNYWQFDKTISYAYFPSEEVRHGTQKLKSCFKVKLGLANKNYYYTASAKYFIHDQPEWEKLKNNIILEIYYESLDYTVIKHVTVLTTSNIISQLGGQFSLWIGGSIISIIQLFIYFGRGTYSSAKQHAKRRIPKNEDKSPKLEDYRMIKF